MLSLTKILTLIDSKSYEIANKELQRYGDIIEYHDYEDGNDLNRVKVILHLHVKFIVDMCNGSTTRIIYNV